MNAYRDKAARLARTVTEEDFLTCDCDCFQVSKRRATPEDYQTVYETAKAFFHHSAVKTLYWAVHFQGKHVLSVKGMGVAEAHRATLRA